MATPLKIKLEELNAERRKKIEARAAGPIRNQQMLDEARPDFVIAFPGGKGTADMISRAKKAGIPLSKSYDRGSVRRSDLV